MGAEQPNQTHPQTQMEQINLSLDDKKKLERSKNKPNNNYAKLASQKPKALKVVQQIRIKFEKAQKFSAPNKEGEELPLYEMSKVPGCFYHGCWFNGKQHGKGQIFTKSGVYFHGQFNNGVADCKDGLLVFPDGSYYRGNFTENSFNGKGLLKYEEFNGNNTSTVKFSYDGNWKQNLAQGPGIQTYQDGSKYEGNFVAGKKHGQGKFTWASGKVYEGKFVEGHMEGQGKLSFNASKNHQDAGEFVGKFQRGLKVEGHLRTKFGKYEGKYLHGLMHDEKAKFTWKDGKVYEGGFEFGQMHGAGRMIFHNKQGVSGRWQKGENIRIDEIIGDVHAHK